MGEKLIVKLRFQKQILVLHQELIELEKYLSVESLHKQQVTTLKKHFGGFGTVVNAVIMMDRATNRSRGFGFVTFESEDTVDEILNRTHQFSSKTVEVKKAVPKGKIEEVSGRGRDTYGGYDGYPYPPPALGPYGYYPPPPPYGYPYAPRGPPRFPYPPYPAYGRGRGMDPYNVSRGGFKDRGFHPYH